MIILNLYFNYYNYNFFFNFFFVDCQSNSILTKIFLFLIFIFKIIFFTVLRLKQESGLRWKYYFSTVIMAIMK